MSFIEVASWRTPTRPYPPLVSVESFAARMPFVFGMLSRLHFRRPMALTASAAVHILILLLYLSASGEEGGQGSQKSGAGTLSVFTLTPPSEAPSESAAPQPASQARPVPAQRTTQAVPPAQEWSTALVRIPTKTSLSNSSPNSSAVRTMSPTGTGTAATAGAAGGGQQSYDPYAGASPQRRQDGWGRSASSGLGSTLSSFLRPGSNAACSVDHGFLTNLRQGIARQFRGLKGTVMVQVQISEEGQIAHIDIQRQNVGPRAIALLVSRLDGRKICDNDGNVMAGLISLPQFDW